MIPNFKKYALIFSTIFAFTFVSLANENDTVEQPQEDDVIFMVVEKMPEFPGGQPALMRFLAENLRIPIEYREANWVGRVFLQFVVNADGSITDIQVIRGFSPLWDKETIRVVEAMPNWIPGEHRGEKVRVRYTLPINISLQ